jgi:hypothetical protein
VEFAQYIHARRKILVGVIICSGVLLSKEVYFFLKKYTYVEISTPGSTPNSITSTVTSHQLFPGIDPGQDSLSQSGT